jgi:uncharacterized protein (DUF58 family)
MPQPPLLSSTFLKKLEGLELTSHRTFTAGVAGERQAHRKGGGLEFVDHKAYSPGDDFRYLDWNVYARNQQLVVKQFETTESLPTYILLDTSASMDFGHPTKLLWGKQLAAAVTYLAICREDRLGLFPFADGLRPEMISTRGRGQVQVLFDFLDAQPAQGTTSLERALTEFANRIETGGLLFVISDFWDLAGFQRGLQRLAFRGFAIQGIQIISPEELDPSYTGELDLLDSESGDRAWLTIRKGTLDRYRDALRRDLRQLQFLLSGVHAGCLRLSTAESVEDTVLFRFRREGIVR